MRWKFFTALFVIALLIPSHSKAANTETISAQIEIEQKNRQALIAEEARLQAEFNAISKESQNLGSAVKSLDATKKKIANDIKITQSKINSANLNIQVLQNNVNTAERQISTHHRAITTALQRLSEYDKRPLWLDILASGSFADLWTDKSQLVSLNDDLATEVDSLRETKEVLIEEKEKKEKVKEQAVSLQNELSSQKAVVEESQKAKEKLLAQTKNKEAEYQKLLADNMARQRQSEQDLSDLEEQLRITLDPSLFPSAKHGILSWPLDYVYITGKFGKSDCRIYPPPNCFHNGTDFRASVGTPVRAMASGVVAGADNTDRQKGCGSYGNWILLKYDNGLSSVYSHLSASLVKDGQRVEKGQVVAYSGGALGAYGSGLSTGQHLHVGLFASQGVQVALFTTSKGCKQVYVPLAKGRDAYLNPLAYLPAL